MSNTTQELRKKFVSESDLYEEIVDRVGALLVLSGLNKLGDSDGKAVSASMANPMALMGKLSKVSEYLEHMPEVKKIMALSAEYFQCQREIIQLLMLKIIELDK
jgi:hypothetical protein